MAKRVGFLIAAVLTLSLFSGASHAAQSFFEGKTVRIIVGFSAGGGFDAYSRAIARQLGKHIPGNPTVIVENMPGAGSLILANHMFKVAKPDGLTIGNFHGYQILNQVVESPGVDFDARKFEWLGVPVQDTGACALTKASGITSLEKWKDGSRTVKLGATSPGDATYISARILKEVLGLPVQVITGYKGTSDIRIAAESGEVAGGCWQWESIKPTWRNALEAGDVVVVLQMIPKPHPELSKVPLALSLAKNDEERLLLKVAIHDPNSITRPYSLPPGTPRDRVQLLRKAFMDTMKDSEFLSEARKSSLDLAPLSGEEVEGLVHGFFKIKPSSLSKLKEILK